MVQSLSDSHILCGKIVKCEDVLSQRGIFHVGCNYWASHAGMLMWRDWRPEIIEKDFTQLAECGIQVMRVFPLWSDFQPLTRTEGCSGQFLDLRFGETPLPSTPPGKAGISEIMLERFRFLCDCAQKNNIQLIVGLITGWMSGRLFVPPAFSRMNCLTEPEVVKWQVRFVKHFVKTLRDHQAICAWDLGNECNCIAPATRDQAWCWSNTISSAIRTEDSTRPIISGMHSLSASKNDNAWKIQDQGELTDILTTHPYPLFTPFCNQEPLNKIRNCLHATAESLFYAGVSGKPCIAEEVGNLGPCVCSDELAGEYMRTALFTLWAHDCRSLLWWCAYDQDLLENSPYDWVSIERELGLIKSDRTPKPAIKEMGKFAEVIKSLPLDRLPQRKVEAVCILTEGQDCWAAAFSAFILAKQAGFDLEFRFVGQQLPNSQLYIIPSLSSSRHSNIAFWKEIKTRAENGATIYVSHNDGIISNFKKIFGAEIISREIQNIPIQYEFNNYKLTGHPAFKLNLQAKESNVLATDNYSNPSFLCNKIGQGKIYFLSFPLEKNLSETKDAFGTDSEPAWKIYKEIGREVITKRIVSNDNPYIGITEHSINEKHIVVILINYGMHHEPVNLTIAEGWTVDNIHYGKYNFDNDCIDQNNAIILSVTYQ